MKLTIPTIDGHKIQAIFEGKSNPSIVLLLHGIASEKNEGNIYTNFVSILIQNRIDSLRFDFRGHGESALLSEKATIAGEIIDLLTVYQHIVSIGYKRIYILAASFGASVYLLANSVFSFSRVRRAVLWNPVISYINTFIDSKVEWGKTFYKHKNPMELIKTNSIRIPESEFNIGIEMSIEMLYFKPEETFSLIHIPTLMIHGNEDTMVPHKDTKTFCGKVGKLAKYIGIDKADHGFEDYTEIVYQHTLEWIRENKK